MFVAFSPLRSDVPRFARRADPTSRRRVLSAGDALSGAAGSAP